MADYFIYFTHRLFVCYFRLIRWLRLFRSLRLRCGSGRLRRCCNRGLCRLIRGLRLFRSLRLRRCSGWFNTWFNAWLDAWLRLRCRRLCFFDYIFRSRCWFWFFRNLRLRCGTNNFFFLNFNFCHRYFFI